MPQKDRDLIRKFWLYPQTRPQIKNLIDTVRKKHFALLDAAERENNRWHDMESEYRVLLNLERLKEEEKKEPSAWREANPEQAEGRLNRD